MIKDYNQYINEFYAENYNKFYYLVLRSKESTIESLNDGKFVGLVGISDSEKIIDAFFDVRDILLVMPKKDTESINNKSLKKINYSDIDDICDNNFAVFRRLYDVDETYSVNSLIYQARQRTNRVEHMKKIKKPITPIILNMYNHIYNYKYDSYNVYREFIVFLDYYGTKVIPENASNFSELCETVFQNISDENLIKNTTYTNYNPQNFISSFTKKVVEYVLKFIILNFMDSFKNEGEVLVMSDTFKIPQSSFLIVKRRKYEREYDYETALKEVNKYPIYWINKTDTSHKNAYHIIRNYNKIFNI